MYHQPLYHQHQHWMYHQPYHYRPHPTHLHPYPPQQLEQQHQQVDSSVEENYTHTYYEKNRLKEERGQETTKLMKQLKEQRLMEQQHQQVDSSVEENYTHSPSSPSDITYYEKNRLKEERGQETTKLMKQLKEQANEYKSYRQHHEVYLKSIMNEMDSMQSKMDSMLITKEPKSQEQRYEKGLKSQQCQHANKYKSYRQHHEVYLKSIMNEMDTMRSKMELTKNKEKEMDSMQSKYEAKLTKISGETDSMQSKMDSMRSKMELTKNKEMLSMQSKMDSMRSKMELTKNKEMLSMQSKYEGKLTKISGETDSMQSKYEAAMRVALLVCTMDTDRKANEKEAKRLMKEAKGETTRNVLDEDWWNRGSACTTTSKFRQAAVEKGQTDPGRFTVKSAKQFGFHCINILDDLLLEEAKLQLLDCTASKCILSIDHPGVQELIKLLQKSFYRGEEKCHSRLHFNHANFHAPKGMNEIYKAVALELGDGITIRSASNFRNKAIALAEKAPAETETVGTVPAASIDDMPELLDEEETNPGTDVTTWTSLELMQFLGDHWDTHALPTTFFSFSANDSYVYYKLQNKIVAKLLIPAGFSIVVTTEIHSGLKTLNPYKLKHCSESSDDRLLFRIVHQVGPEGINMDRSSDSWLKFATDALKKIFNRQK